MILEIESVWIEIVDSVANHAVDGGDNADDNAEADHGPKPFLHTNDFEQNVHVIERNERFPTFFAGFFEDFPVGNDKQDIENYEIN